MTTYPQNVNDAIARRNIDRKSDGSLSLPNGKPITPANVAQCITYVHKQPYGLEWRARQLERLNALPEFCSIDQLREVCVGDSRAINRNAEIRQEQYQVRESNQYITDLENALEYVTQEI